MYFFIIGRVNLLFKYAYIHINSIYTKYTVDMYLFIYLFSLYKLEYFPYRPTVKLHYILYLVHNRNAYICCLIMISFLC